MNAPIGNLAAAGFTAQPEEKTPQGETPKTPATAEDGAAPAVGMGEGTLEGAGGSSDSAAPHPWNNLPLEMRNLVQWAVSAPSTSPDKSPKQVDGRDAKSNTPETWTSFIAACGHAYSTGRNIGFMHLAENGIVTIDIDWKDKETHPNEPDKWTTPQNVERFQKIVEAAELSGTYVERSRSGKGWHIIGFGTLPNNKGRKRDGVEIYNDKRYMIATGNSVTTPPQPLVDIQWLIDPQIALMPVIKDDGSEGELDVKQTLKMDEIHAQLSEHGNSEKYLALFNGDWQKLKLGDGSQSTADNSLIQSFCWAGATNAQALEMFKGSALAPSKRPPETLKSNPNDYIRRTVRKARLQLAYDAEKVAMGAATAKRLLEKAPGYPVLTDDELAAQPRPKWIVKNLVPASGIGTIYGASQTYKSFLALDLLAHIARGEDWFGFRVKQVPAVYVPFEGKGGVPKRVEAWRRASKSESDLHPSTKIGFIMEATNLREPLSRANLIASLKNIGPVGVACIDTLAQAGPGIKENDSDGMGEMVGIFQAIYEASGWVVLVIHHAGKNISAGLRGHSSLEGAVDFAIACYRIKEELNEKEEPNEKRKVSKEPRTWFESYKVKDAESGDEYDFEMERVVLGTDEDGDEESSLVVRKPSVTTPFMDQAYIAARAAKEAAIAEKEIRLNKEIDDVIWKYVFDLWAAGKPPSKKYVEENIKSALADHRLSQIAIRKSLERMLVEQRLTTEGTGPKTRIRAIEDAHLRK